MSQLASIVIAYVRSSAVRYAILIFALCAVTAGARADDLDERFKRVTTGLTRGAIAALMGQPNAEAITHRFSVPEARLLWKSGPPHIPNRRRQNDV